MNTSAKNTEKMGTTSEPVFEWVEETLAVFSKSFPGEYPLELLQDFHYCIGVEMLISDKNRLICLFETLLDFYHHFYWKIKFKKPSENMKYGFIKLLANLIKIGLTVKYEARLRIVLTVLKDEEELLYSALLLVTHLKKKCQESYGVLLGDVLCSTRPSFCTPETYLKIILLLRRLQSLTRKKPRQMPVPPLHTILWLRQHCPDALPKNPKQHTLTNHLLQKKLPGDVLKNLREVLLPFDDKPVTNETMENLESEYRKKKFVIDTGDASFYQDLNHLTEQSTLKKEKRKSTIKEEKSNQEGLEKRALLEEFGEKVSQKKSKKRNHSLETEESVENDRSNLPNGIENALDLLYENTEHTKSKKKRRKSEKGKNSTPQLCDQVNKISSVEGEIKKDEPKINPDTLNESGDIEEESFEKETSSQEEMITSSSKKRHLSDSANGSPSSSGTTEKDSDSLSCSKKRKVSKRKKLPTSKEEINNQSCNLSLITDSVSDNGNMSKPLENCHAPTESHSVANSSQELDHEEDASEEKVLPKRLKIKKNQKAIEIQSPNSAQTKKSVKSNKSSSEVSPSDLEQHTNLEEGNVMESMLIQGKQGLKTPKKSKKSLKDKGSKSPSDSVQKPEEKETNVLENEEQLLESPRKLKSKDSEVTNDSQNKLGNSLPILLGVKDLKVKNDIKVRLESEANISNECKLTTELTASSTDSKYEEHPVLPENSVSISQENNLSASAMNKKFNIEIEEMTDNHEESSNQDENRLSSIDLAIQENLKQLTEENSETDLAIQENVRQLTGENSKVDLAIQKNLRQLADENSEAHCVETDSFEMPKMSDSSSGLKENKSETICVEENSAKETACFQSDNLTKSPTNLIKELKEECLNETDLGETSEQSDDTRANGSETYLNDPLKSENDSEEITENKVKVINITWRSSSEDEDRHLHSNHIFTSNSMPFIVDPKEEDAVKSEEQNLDHQLAVEGERQIRSSDRIRVFPRHIKKNEENSDEEPVATVLANSSSTTLDTVRYLNCFALKTSPKKEQVGAHTETNIRNEGDHENQAISVYRSESKRGTSFVQGSESSTKEVCVKSQSSDSEMSVKEANINEYEEILAENTEPNEKRDSDRSDPDRNVEELSECLLTSGQQMPKTNRCTKKNIEKFQPTNGAICYDSDESISSLNLEEEENSSNTKSSRGKVACLPKSKSLSKKKIDESKSLNPEHKSQELFDEDNNVEEGSVNKSTEQVPLFTPRKSKRLQVGKHSVSSNASVLDAVKSPRKLRGSSPDSIKIQNTSHTDPSAVDDKATTNSTVLSDDKNEANSDSKSKSTVERITRSKRVLHTEKAPEGTKNCSVMLVNILESATALTEVIKEELSSTDEELVQKVSQEKELNSTKKDSSLSHCPDEKNDWTLDYESDSASENGDKKGRENSRCLRRSKNLSKTVKPSSNLDPAKKLAKSSEPEPEVGSRRYNLRRTPKTFPNVKQPASQKLAPIPRMTFSPLVRKAANYLGFSDVCAAERNLESIREEIFNDKYRESPADLTVTEAEVTMADETLSNGYESSQPIESREGAEPISSENSTDFESSQVISESANDKPLQQVKSGNASDLVPVKNSEAKSPSPEPLICISKSRLKARSSKKQSHAKGYSLRSRGASSDLDLNLEELSIGSPEKKDSKKDTKPEVPKEESVAKDSHNLRRSKRNVVLPGKLKL